jgi:hypothetical protein
MRGSTIWTFEKPHPLSVLPHLSWPLFVILSRLSSENLLLAAKKTSLPHIRVRGTINVLQSKAGIG